MTGSVAAVEKRVPSGHVSINEQGVVECFVENERVCSIAKESIDVEDSDQLLEVVKHHGGVHGLIAHIQTLE